MIFVLVLHVLVCFMLILVVLLQPGNKGGMGAAFGGGVGLVHGALTGDPVKGAAHGVVLGAAAGALVGAADHIFDDGNSYDRARSEVDGGYNNGYQGGYQGGGYGNGGYYQPAPNSGYTQAYSAEIDPRTGYRLPPPEYRRY